MKIRLNFVSNSSSASFILDKRYLVKEDIKAIKQIAKKVLSEDFTHYDIWKITENEEFLKGFTIMDNGYLFDWIKHNLNIPLKAIVSYEKD